MFMWSVGPSSQKDPDSVLAKGHQPPTGAEMLKLLVQAARDIAGELVI